MSSKGLVTQKKTWFSQQVALDATADVAVFYPGTPVDIVRVGFTQTTAATGTGLVLKFDSQLFTIATGAAAARGDGDVATVTPGVAPTVTKGYVNELSTPFELDAGEGVIAQVTTAQTAGDGVIFIEYIEKPFVGDSTVTAGNPSNRISQMTVVTS